jgi:hypothetical protein
VSGTLITAMRYCILLALGLSALSCPATATPLEQRQQLDGERRRIQERLAGTTAKRDHVADVQIFLRAVEWGLLYETTLDSKDVASIKAALKRAGERLELLKAGRPAWATRKGRLVRGFFSAVDGSVQPYGLIVPASASPTLKAVIGRREGKWAFLGELDSLTCSGKRPGVQGPIDDAFTAPFLCVRGTGKAWHPAIKTWSEVAPEPLCSRMEALLSGRTSGQRGQCGQRAGCTGPQSHPLWRSRQQLVDSEGSPQDAARVDTYRVESGEEPLFWYRAPTCVDSAESIQLNPVRGPQ